MPELDVFVIEFHGLVTVGGRKGVADFVAQAVRDEIASNLESLGSGGVGGSDSIFIDSVDSIDAKVVRTLSPQED